LEKLPALRADVRLTYQAEPGVGAPVGDLLATQSVSGPPAMFYNVPPAGYL